MINVQEVLRLLYWFKQYVFEFSTGIHYIDTQTIHIEDLKESLGLIFSFPQAPVRSYLIHNEPAHEKMVLITKANS